MCSDPELIPLQLLESIIDEKKSTTNPTKKLQLTAEHLFKYMKAYPLINDKSKNASAADITLINAGKDEGLSLPSMRECFLVLKTWENRPGSGYLGLEDFQNIFLPRNDNLLKSEVL